LNDRGEDPLASLSALHAEEPRRLAGYMSELAAGL